MQEKLKLVVSELQIVQEACALPRYRSAKSQTRLLRHQGALLVAMPEKAHAMTQKALFEKAGVITKTTGQRALGELLVEGKILRTGKGAPRDLYRCFAQKK